MEVENIEKFFQVQSTQDEVHLKHQPYSPHIQLPNVEPIPPSTIKSPKLDLKPLLDYLRYTFLGEDKTLPVIISSKLTQGQEEMLIKILRKRIKAIS